MKKYKFILTIIALAEIFVSCTDDFLTIYPRNSIAAGAPATQDVIEQYLTGAYQILLFDSYANGVIAPVVLFGDFRSDDIYKGGADASDQPTFNYLAQYQSSSVDVPDGWWSIFYTGLKRCNNALTAMDNAVEVNPDVLARLRAEALTLRAYYVHWLWKAWGNIPYYEKSWTEEPFIAPQYSFDEIYPKLIADLDEAINTSQFPMAVSGIATGRVNKAMAMMTKARVVMYAKDVSKYADVLADMNTIINCGTYELIKTVPAGSKEKTKNPIEWIFMREGEFCRESIFESNNISEGKWWNYSWGGFGNYMPSVVSPRSLVDPAKVFTSGWGWCTVQPTAYAIFNEAGDYRKEASVTQYPTGPIQTEPDGTKYIQLSGGGKYVVGYQNTGLFLRKYAARVGYNNCVKGDPPLNFENNERIYRLAETYLNAAELSYYIGGEGGAQPYLDAIRARAFGDAVHGIPATLNNIKLERRRELFGEGHRFWDLVRWGSDEKDRSIEQTLSVSDTEYNLIRTYTDDKRFLPIPKNEIDKTKGTQHELQQNPGWQ